MLASIDTFFADRFRRWFPDFFVFAILLTFVSGLLALVVVGDTTLRLSERNLSDGLNHSRIVQLLISALGVWWLARHFRANGFDLPRDRGRGAPAGPGYHEVDLRRDALGGSDLRLRRLVPADLIPPGMSPVRLARLSVRLAPLVALALAGSPARVAPVLARAPLVGLAFAGLLVGPAAGPAAAKDGSIAVNGTRMWPLEPMADYVDPEWGIGAQLAWPAPAIQRDMLVQLGLAWTNFHEHERATSGGVRRDSQDYWRFWIGPRWDIPIGGRFQPYLAANAAAVRHSNTVTLDQGSGRQDLGSQVEWGFGWDLTLGAEFDPWRGIGLYGGFRYLKSYGLELPRDASETIAVDPEYLEAFGGIFFKFARLGLILEDDVD